MKSARAGFELVAAMSAPSSLAIKTADRAGLGIARTADSRAGSLQWREQEDAA
jgi:formate dehydrogenase assembly factor FdhD